MVEHKASGRAVGATTLIRLAGLAPPTLHSLGVRIASQFSSHSYNVLVTNVPGPPRPLYAMGARMIDMYPVVPLAGGQAVSIGITSYDGACTTGSMPTATRCRTSTCSPTRCPRRWPS